MLVLTSDRLQPLFHARYPTQSWRSWCGRTGCYFQRKEYQSLCGDTVWQIYLSVICRMLRVIYTRKTDVFIPLNSGTSVTAPMPTCLSRLPMRCANSPRFWNLHAQCTVPRIISMWLAKRTPLSRWRRAINLADLSGVSTHDLLKLHLRGGLG